MKMTRQHFELIADAIRTAPQNPTTRDGNAIRQDLAEHFADRLGATNPLFQRDKFIERATRPE